MKRKSENFTPKKTKKKSLRSNETFLITWNNICFEEDKSKKEKVVEKLKIFLTKHRFQESVLSAYCDMDDEWRISVLGRVEFLWDCKARNCRYHNAFFFTNFCHGKRKLKRFYSQKKITESSKTGISNKRPCIL